MVELLTVLVLLGIMGVIVASRIATTGGYQLAAEERIVKAHVRHVQFLAMSNNTRSWAISFSADHYTLYRDGSVAPVRLPNEDSSTRNLPSGLSITCGTGMVAFDEWGSPGETGHTLTLSDGEAVRSITISGKTGFVQ